MDDGCWGFFLFPVIPAPPSDVIGASQPNFGNCRPLLLLLEVWCMNSSCYGSYQTIILYFSCIQTAFLIVLGEIKTWTVHRR